MIHELKIELKYYQRVADGSKTFEVRNNDRDFQYGDEVFLNAWDKDKGQYSGEHINLHFRIGYVLPLENGYVVFSLLPIEKRIFVEKS